VQAAHHNHKFIFTKGEVPLYFTSATVLALIKQKGVGQQLPLEPDLGSTSEQQH